MSSEDFVDAIGTCAIARLGIQDGDVLMLQSDEKWTPEQRHYYARAIEDWATDRGKQWNVLPLPDGMSVTVVTA